MVQAGKLNRYLTYQQPVETVDTEGNVILTYKDLVKLWAYIEPLTGSEQLLAGQVEAKRAIRIVVRYHPTVRAKGRLSYVTPVETRTFEISSVADADEAHRELDLLCEELDTGGVNV